MSHLNGHPEHLSGNELLQLAAEGLAGTEGGVPAHGRHSTAQHGTAQNCWQGNVFAAGCRSSKATRGRMASTAEILTWPHALVRFNNAQVT